MFKKLLKKLKDITNYVFKLILSKLICRNNCSLTLL